MHNLQNIYNIISVVLFLLLGIIWTKRNFANFTIKTIFWGMTIFGLYILFKN